MPAVSRTTYVFTVLHPSDQPPESIEAAMREAFDGHSVGAVVHEVTGPVPDEAVPGALVELGNDGAFFDDDLSRGTCRHCGQVIERDDANGWVHTEDGVVGCGAPLRESETYAEPA